MKVTSLGELVVFICAGNTCRSPMAEYLLKMLYKQYGLRGEVASAGLTVPGIGLFVSPTSTYHTRPSEKAVAVMKEIDPQTDIEHHVPGQLCRHLLYQATLLLTMQETQRDDILDFFSQIGKEQEGLGKVFTLKEFADESKELDIKDPLGGGYIGCDFSSSGGHRTYRRNYVVVQGYDPDDDRDEEDEDKKPDAFCAQSTLLEYQTCRDEIRTCLEKIIAQPPNKDKLLKAREQRNKTRKKDKWQSSWSNDEDDIKPSPSRWRAPGGKK